MTRWAPLRRWATDRTLRNLATALVESGVPAGRPAAALRVPGRVELFGKHTDYAGGRSLVAAIERGMVLLVAARDDRELRWLDVGRGVTTRFDLAHIDLRPSHWSNYLRAVARRLGRDIGPLRTGADVAMASNLPAASGLSSSSALVVATFLALDAVGGLRERFPWPEGDNEKLAGYLGAAEAGRGFADFAGDDGVGTFGGSEDHAAILAGRAGRLLQLRFAPIELEAELALAGRWQLAIGVSGVRADKTGSAQAPYNRLATLAAEVAEIWRWNGGDGDTLGAILASGVDVQAILAAIGEAVSTRERRAALQQRIRHFAVESELLVPSASAAFAADDVGALGRLSAESQRLAEEWLGNQTAETSALVKSARMEGASAASAFGAGFGGAVWALVESREATAFLGRWEAAYRLAFPDHRAAASFLLTGAADGARWLEPPETVEET